MPEYIQLWPVGREVEFPDDVKRLRSALRSKGYDACDEHIQWAWQYFSDSHWTLGWLPLGGLTDAVLAEKLLQYLEPVEGDHDT